MQLQCAIPMTTVFSRDSHGKTEQLLYLITLWDRSLDKSDIKLYILTIPKR